MIQNPISSILPLLISVLTLVGCSSNKEAQSSVATDESLNTRLDRVSIHTSDLSQAINVDRNMVLSGIRISYYNDTDSTFVNPGGKVNAIVNIDRIDFTDNQSVGTHIHDENSDSIASRSEFKNNSRSSNDVKHSAEVFKPPALLLIFAFAVATIVLLYLLGLLTKLIRK